MKNAKVCTKCKQEKPLDQFNKHKITKYFKDGLQYWCKLCKKIHRSEYYLKNKENLNRYNSKWFKSNPEYKKSQKNKEYGKMYQKEYFKTEQGKAVNARNSHKRRVLTKNTICDLTSQQWFEIKQSQDFRCLHCGKPEPEIKLTRDHIIPVKQGGGFTKSNIQGLCRSCNTKKKDKVDSLAFVMILKEKEGEKSK